MSSDELQPKPLPPSALGPWVAGCLGAIAAVFAVLLYFLWVAWQSRSPWADISEAELLAAQARWQVAKPADYRMRLRIVGPRSGEVVITVRGGKPAELLQDGRPIEREQTRSSWTVDGLMHLVRFDLDTLAADGHNSLRLVGEFDPANGVPLHYRRIQFDPPLETGWDVVEWTTELGD